MARRVLLIVPTLLLLGCADGQPTSPGALSSPEVVRATPGLLVGSTTVLLTGLDAPKGIAFGPQGALYVVESGNTSINGPCIVEPRGEKCYSGTGAVTRYWKGRQERVASGLPSVYVAAVNDITGPADIGFLGVGDAIVSIGWGGPPAGRALLGAYSTGFGDLIKLAPSGHWKVVADVSAVEDAENPAGGPVDSNPFGLLNEAGARFVADAGGNSLIQVMANGATSVVATFPSLPAPPPFSQSEAVPTEVQRGPDGALYVSTLSGVPFLSGNARIYRVVPGQAPTVYIDGFKTITDFAFAPDGGLYVVEYASAPVFFGGPGKLTYVAPDGARTVLKSDLTFPTAVAVGPDGAIYVSNKGNMAGVGEVLRIVP